MPTLQQDPEFRTLAQAFFAAARRAIITPEQGFALFSRGDLRFSASGTFDMELTRDALAHLVRRCVRLLGASVVEEEDVASLAWDFADRVASDDPLIDISALATEFAGAAEQWRAAPVRHFLPNHVIQLADGTPSLSAGPVSIRRWHDLINEMPVPDGGESTWRFAEGSPGLTIVDGHPVFSMTRTCWDVTVPASPGSRGETAFWMVDVAISLIRLSGVLGSSPFAPRTGKVEAKSGGPLGYSAPGITMSGTTLSSGSQTTLGSYAYDVATADASKVEALAGRGERIFRAQRGSVAERIQQGLGWLTRGRTAQDRAERFLYFFTALEALLSSDDKSAPVVQTIARHASVLWTNDNAARTRVAAHLRELYAERSALVHTGKRGISSSSARSAQHIIEGLFYRVLEAERLDQKFATLSAELGEATYGLPWPPAQSPGAETS